jgi:DNA-binding protein HU-beta
MTSSKSDLIAAVAKRNGSTKAEVKRILDATFDIINALALDGPVAIHNFGVFKRKTRAARAGRNPQTGAVIQIAESTSLHFKATKHK